MDKCMFKHLQTIDMACFYGYSLNFVHNLVDVDAVRISFLLVVTISARVQQNLVVFILLRVQHVIAVTMNNSMNVRILDNFRMWKAINLHMHWKKKHDRIDISFPYHSWQKRMPTKPGPSSCTSYPAIEMMMFLAVNHKLTEFISLIHVECVEKYDCGCLKTHRLSTEAAGEFHSLMYCIHRALTVVACTVWSWRRINYLRCMF